MRTIGSRRAPLGTVAGWFAGAGAGLVPIAAAVALDPTGWYPFGPAKQSAVAVAALAAVGCAAWAPAAGRLPRHVAWLWIAVLAWLALAAALGEDRWYAWIGTPERRLGWLTWALFAASAWAGAQFGRSAHAVRLFVRLAAVAGAWTGGYCLAELWWRAPVETSDVTARLGGPFGSAAYLGAALCLLLPLATALAADAEERHAWRVVAGFAVVSGTVGLLGSGTRAAWVAVATAAVVAALVARRSWRVLLAGAAVLVVALLVVAPRLGDVSGRQGGGGSSRVAEWEVAARVIAAHPVVGAGPEGYRIAFADGVDAHYERTYGRDVLPDRAHSAVLDAAAIGGAPAAVLYAALLAAVVWFAWKALRDGDRRTAGLGAAAIAYVVQQQFLFPLAEIDPTFWLIAGIVLARPPAGSARAHPSPKRLVAAACWVLAAGMFAAGVLGVAADRSARVALRRPPGSDVALAAAERAADLRPDVVRYHLLVGAIYAERQSVAGARGAVAAAGRAIDISPGDPVAREALAEASTRLATVTGDPDDLAAARAHWERLVADDPHCRNCWSGLGTVRVLADDVDGAEAAFARARELGAGT